MILDAIAQVVVPVLGTVTVSLLARERRSGYVIWLVAQPVWTCTAVLHRQWGAVLSSAVVTVAFADGLRRTRRVKYERVPADARG